MPITGNRASVEVRELEYMRLSRSEKLSTPVSQSKQTLILLILFLTERTETEFDGEDALYLPLQNSIVHNPECEPKCPFLLTDWCHAQDPV